MKVKEALAEIKKSRQGAELNDAQLVSWLSNVEGHLWDDFLCNYEPTTEEYQPFDINTPGVMDKELYAKEPYTNVYTHYLQAMIDYENADSQRFTNSMIMYNSAVQTFGDYYNRTHNEKWVGISV